MVHPAADTWYRTSRKVPDTRKYGLRIDNSQFLRTLQARLLWYFFRDSPLNEVLEIAV